MYLLAHSPTSLPSSVPSVVPTQPSGEPSALPSSDPSARPTQMPSDSRVWNEAQKLLASDGAVGDQFGSSVYLSGDEMFVAARKFDGAGPSTGR